MYADRITAAMNTAIEETNRRRHIQAKYNEDHGIVPASIVKSVRDITDRIKSEADESAALTSTTPTQLPKAELVRLLKELDEQMRSAAKSLEFEQAALLRDQTLDVRKALVDLDTDAPEWERQRRLAFEDWIDPSTLAG